jgi:hypothetical protein
MNSPFGKIDKNSLSGGNKVVVVDSNANPPPHFSPQLMFAQTPSGCLLEDILLRIPLFGSIFLSAFPYRAFPQR